MRCRIRLRSGDLISAVDGVTCDNEASVAKKTKPGNQSLGVAVLVCLKRQESARNNIEFARKNHDPLYTFDLQAQACAVSSPAQQPLGGCEIL